MIARRQSPMTKLNVEVTVMLPLLSVRQVSPLSLWRNRLSRADSTNSGSWLQRCLVRRAFQFGLDATARGRVGRGLRTREVRSKELGVRRETSRTDPMPRSDRTG